MKTVITLLLCLFLIPLIEASVIPESCSDIKAYDYAALTECNLDTYVSTSNQILSGQIELYSNKIIDVTKGTAVELDESRKYFGIFRYLFTGFLLIIIFLTGYQFMINSENPAKRDETKRTFLFIIFAGILVASLPLIITETNNLSVTLNTLFLRQTSLPDTFEDFNFPDYAEGNVTVTEQGINRLENLLSTAPFFSGSAKAYLISMNARHLVILVLVSLSPLILLLYILKPTREYGRLLTSLFLLEMFYPVINIIILHFSIVLSGAETDITLLSSALILSVIFHIILILTAIIKASIGAAAYIRRENGS